VETDKGSADHKGKLPELLILQLWQKKTEKFYII
jgi:hypothetical protein